MSPLSIEISFKEPQQVAIEIPFEESIHTAMPKMSAK
jgi:hypothetical protein